MPITYENHPKYDVVCNDCGKTFTGIYGERCPDCNQKFLADFGIISRNDFSGNILQSQLKNRGDIMDGLQIGRNVHYVVEENEHRVALITKVWSDDGVINLTYFNDGSRDVSRGIPQDTIRVTSVRYDEEHAVGTWHWIEKA